LRVLWFRFARWLCKIFCIACFRFRICGIEHIPSQGAFLLAANHQSVLDPVFCGIFLRRPLHFLARDTLFRNWFFGRLIASVNTTPVRRGEADIAAIRVVIAKLKEGKGVCLFPEATRTIDGKIAPFKGGFTLLCRRGNAPVVPVLIDGAFECWPRHRKLPIFGSHITVRYGKPISAEQARAMEDRELARSLTETLRAMQTELRIQQGKQPYQYT